MKMEEVTISKQVHLKTIAKRLGIHYGRLKDMNPELRHYLTPDSPYSLKVSLGKGEVLLAKLSEECSIGNVERKVGRKGTYLTY